MRFIHFLFEHATSFVHGDAHAVKFGVKLIKKDYILLYRGKLLEYFIKGNETALLAFREEAPSFYVALVSAVLGLLFCRRAFSWETMPFRDSFGWSSFLFLTILAGFPCF